MNVIVIGAQWGDEGKGKIIDVLSEKADVVVRYQGGHNAGHTIVYHGQEFVLHLVPSGILRPHTRCVIGNGVVVDPDAFLNEIEFLEKKGLRVKGRLFLSDQAHLIFPYHRIYDQLREKKKGFIKIGTTGRGIGPCYSDKALRSGIRVADLYTPKLFKDKLTRSLDEKNQIFRHIYHVQGFSFEKIYREYQRFAKRMAPYRCDTVALLGDAIARRRSILFEGAQGTFLDIDHGTYPFVTSSTSTAGGACAGTGVPPTAIDKVVGVAKAYTTRVGEGPFPTEFDQRLMNLVRRLGNEFGATTGRPRRCGWFDAVVVRRACLLNGIKELVVTKLDVLDTFERIRIAVAYHAKGKIYREFPSDVNILQDIEPIYEDHPGWMSSTSYCRRFKELPKNAQVYLNRISKILSVPITLVSVGSKREQTLKKFGAYVTLA